MKYGSLFTGIGGLDLGLERSIPDLECLWQAEICPKRRKILQKHWPKSVKFNDVREVTLANAERVDLIVGGFPCQDISRAGLKQGITGPKSSLWSEYARIIQEFKPRRILIENVSDLLRRGFDRVLRDLSQSGYDAQWSCITACALGAPHTRERLFVIAYPHGDSESAMRINEALAGLQENARYIRNWWENSPLVLRVDDESTKRLDRSRLAMAGNAVVVKCAELVAYGLSL